MIDIGYVTRVLALLWRQRGKEKLRNIWVESVVSGRCWPNDLDINWHMNNARYLREADFGRFSLLMETGLWDCLLKRRQTVGKQCNVVVSAIQVQYRQSVHLGDRFEFRSRVNGWDDRAFYLEQWMTMERTKETACSFLVRLALVPRRLTPQMLVDDLQMRPISSPPLSPVMHRFRDNHRLNFSPIPSKL